ncbi:MAG: UDP-glucose 4-epimerase, partial [Verrucomicrobiota bacterium]
GEQTRDFISVRDVARANVLAATALNVESGSRNICTGKSRSINELVQIFSAIYPDAPDPIYKPARAAEIIHSCGNGGYATMMLGFEPYISMEDGLCDLVAIQRYESERAA